MQNLIDMTDQVIMRRTAICKYRDKNHICTNFADYTQRLTPDGNPDSWYSIIIAIGDTAKAEAAKGNKSYEPRCIIDLVVPWKKEANQIRTDITPSGITQKTLYLNSTRYKIPDEQRDSIIATLIREKQVKTRKVDGGKLIYLPN